MLEMYHVYQNVRIYTSKASSSLDKKEKKSKKNSQNAPYVQELLSTSFVKILSLKEPPAGSSKQRGNEESLKTTFAFYCFSWIMAFKPLSVT